VQGNYERVVPPSSLDGATSARSELVSTSEYELEEALGGNESDADDEQSGDVQRVLRPATRKRSRRLIAEHVFFRC
jgi:hypothetical protein